MAVALKLRNNNGFDLTIDGQTLIAGEDFVLHEEVRKKWMYSVELMQYVAGGEITVIRDGVELGPIEGWETLEGETLPMSEVGGKLWVHSSPKPVLVDKQTYVQWVGAGDDTTNHILGAGDMLHFELNPGTPNCAVDVKFDPLFGSVYIHEGYCSWHDAGHDDCISALIVAEPSQLQQVANLDLLVDEDGYVKYSPGGPGTGTHGFAATPNLLVRSFSKDGWWDYSEATSLVPNFNKTGGYHICTSEQPVHRFIARIPVFGTCDGMQRFVSSDTFLLPPGYFVRIIAHNGSNTTWHASAMIAVFRERTFQP